jgi:hypothetical protein
MCSPDDVCEEGFAVAESGFVEAGAAVLARRRSHSDDTAGSGGAPSSSRARVS